MRGLRLGLIIGILLLAGLFNPFTLKSLGHWLVITRHGQHADVAVVLAGPEAQYIDRLLSAVDLYHKGVVDRIVINGGRRGESMKKLLAEGLELKSSWHDRWLEVLIYSGVDRRDILSFQLSDAYDTGSEAQLVSRQLRQFDIDSVIVVTSGFHTRRAYHIWLDVADHLDIGIAAANGKNFDPENWWWDPRQVRLMMTEFGGWVFAVF